MREQPVVADANAEVDGQNPKDRSDCQPAPTEVKQRSHCANVKRGNEACGNPIDAAVVGFATHADFFSRGGAFGGCASAEAGGRLDRCGNCRRGVLQDVLGDWGHPGGSLSGDSRFTYRSQFQFDWYIDCIVSVCSLQQRNLFGLVQRLAEGLETFSFQPRIGNF
jgi:hypothetical protein